MTISKEIFGISSKTVEDKAYTCKQSCVDIGWLACEIYWDMKK